MMEQFDKNRLYHGFYLNDWGGTSESFRACDFCELSDECDRLSDDLNNIEYCMCLSEGCIKDTQYKVKHKDAYFKNINNLI